MIVFNQEDFNTNLHPFIWYELCEQLLPQCDLPDSRHDYPESITIYVSAARAT